MPGSLLLSSCLCLGISSDKDGKMAGDFVVEYANIINA
ncbi:hypothetical protein ESCAB7627_0347 [Escherichia albertii TW07627]|uniref:Uncharacterized protein n=1 Tax=Escherichia albertii (strain TW07627) TaxID=502347 RepID=A0ABC9NPT7_ESCAT|nr:hypothetical protein ESCAB7627_0347 [Escherichia albertii TW07627]EHV37012.1 hypothetical protein ECDEC5B_0464 [Escherichia coli DEC5B]EHV51540.1 hypothetical protein ECDEC5E_0114 [Escherichia coli DEC5E]EKI01902.1 hypothetical protein EC5905_0573 [Escherichia coli 5905]